MVEFYMHAPQMHCIIGIYEPKKTADWKTIVAFLCSQHIKICNEKLPYSPEKQYIMQEGVIGYGFC